MSRVVPDVQPTLEPTRRRARAADGCVNGFKSPGPGPLCRQLHLLELGPGTRPSWHGSVNPRRTLWRWSRPLASGSAASNDTRQQFHAKPRQAITPGPPSLRALTRVPSGAARVRRALQATPKGPGGAAFPLINGAVFLLGPTIELLRTAGLDDIEFRAGCDEAKKNYLKEVDRLLK
jgi:hypothetical protein